MHGLINRAIQCFVRDTCGPEAWERLARSADLPVSGFEAMFVYEDDVTERMIDAAVPLLAKPREVLLEDIGIYLVSNPNVDPLRRLLRFGGATFLEFLQSIDDLPRRARLALPDLDLPAIEVISVQEDTYQIGCRWRHDGFGHVLVGMLRTLADDYGALVLLDHAETGAEAEAVTVQILREGFAAGPALSVGVGGAGYMSAGMSLDPAACDALMPLHLRLSVDGGILHTGPTLAKLRRNGTLVGRKMFDVFRLRRPHLNGATPLIPDLVGQRLQIQFRCAPETILTGLMVWDSSAQSLLLNCSFGTALVDAIRDYDLHLPDFAVTDPSIEMLYLIEANTTVLSEWRRLNLRLQSAKTEAEEQAFTDALTGVCNRRAMDRVLDQLIAAGEPFGVIHMDLDYFKQVNDTLGHAAGDHVLQVAAQLMVQTTRAHDTLIRAGGDEFVILLPGTVDQEHLLRLSERLIARLEEPIPFAGEVCHISGSAGITVCHGGGKTGDAVLQEADLALYASKARGRGCATLYRDMPRDGSKDPADAQGGGPAPPDADSTV